MRKIGKKEDKDAKKSIDSAILLRWYWTEYEKATERSSTEGSFPSVEVTRKSLGYAYVNFPNLQAAQLAENSKNIANFENSRI